MNDLFHLALQAPAEQRAALLMVHCPDDPAIRDEVQSLLTAHVAAGDQLESTGLLVPVADSSESAAARLVGLRFGQYQISRMIGQGGMGVVYLAEDLRLGRTVALKAVSPQFTNDPARRERLKREARAAASLAHPGIATVYALEELDGAVFIAGEYVPGVTLREELASGPLDLRRALDTTIELAEALAAAHDRGIVHRDLKPENVIRTPAGHVKILDFGLAQVRASSRDSGRLTEDGTALGTPGYMSPEQIRREDVDARSDLFSLGIVMFEMLTGKNPFKGEDSVATIARVLEVDPGPVGGAPTDSGADPALRREIEGTARICLSKSRDARFSSAHALLAALQRARAGMPSQAVLPVASPSPPLWWWKFHQGATSLAYVLLLMPVWSARGAVGGRPGLLLFLAALVAVVGATILRLHLWFTAASLPAEWKAQREHTRPLMRAADGLFVLVLLVAGLSALDANNGIAELLVGAAVVVLLGFTIIEPATTRAAFGRH